MRTIPWLTSRPIAHRGLHDGNVQVPENSLFAFEDAAARSLPVELDVHVTDGGQVVVFHDYTLERMTGSGQPTRTLTGHDLRRHRLAGTSAHIPTLAEALEVVGGRVPVIVEVKASARPAGAVCRRVAEVLDTYGGPRAVLSFDPRLVAWFARHRRHEFRGLNAGATGSGWWRQRANRRFVGRGWARPDFLGYNVELLPCLRVAHLRQLGYPLLAYTVRTDGQRDVAREHADGCFVELPGLSRDTVHA